MQFTFVVTSKETEINIELKKNANDSPVTYLFSESNVYLYLY